MKWTEPALPEEALFDEAVGQQAGIGHRGQHQGIQPDHDSGDKAAQSAFSGASFPIDSSQQGRGELRG